MEGKVVLITGASCGIGAGTAVLFATRGASVVLVARTEANLKKTAKLCLEAGAKESQILTVAGDVTVEGDQQKMVDQTIAKFGRLDVLVNNAGIGGSGNVEKCSLDTFEECWNVNTKAPFFLTQKCAPHLIKAQGSVVNVSSTAGFRANPIMVAYCCAKRALDHFTRLLALELGPEGVRVNSVNPSTVEDTDMVQKHGGFVAPEKKQEYFQMMRNNVPVKRLCQVKDVAESIYFLASPASAFVTGYVHPVDGGYKNTKRGPYKKFEATIKH